MCIRDSLGDVHGAGEVIDGNDIGECASGIDADAETRCGCGCHEAGSLLRIAKNICFWRYGALAGQARRRVATQTIGRRADPCQKSIIDGAI